MQMEGETGTDMAELIGYLIFLMYQPTQQFCNEQIDTTALVFVYSVEVLLHVSTLSDYHQAIII
jgi:hypothetical protein